MVSVTAEPRMHGVRTGGRGYWQLTGALAIVLMAAVSSLIGVFDGSGWWFGAAFITMVVLAASAAARSIGVPRPIGTLIAVCVLLIVLTVGFDAETAIVGLIPTPATFAHFGDLVAQAFQSANQQEIPATAGQPILFLLEAGVGFAAVVFDLFAVTLRAPALCGIVVAAILAIPLLLLPDGASVLWLVVCAAAYLLLLRASARPRTGQAVSALAMGAGAIVIAVVISTTAPGFLSGVNANIGPDLSFGYGPSPLIDLSKNLRKPATVDVLSYNTKAPGGEYLSLVSLDQFSKGTWTHQAGALRPLTASGTLGGVPGLGGDVASKKVRTDIQTEDVNSPWLPAPYPARAVTGMNADWSWDDEDLSLSSRRANSGDKSYTVRSLDLTPTKKQLRNDSATLPPGISDDVDLPAKVPSIITTTAFRVTAGSTSHYQQAVALQNYFRDGDFSYSLDAPDAEGGDLKVIAAFLKQKSGYCVHFASAMAIMARVLGIPSRVTIGYLPGTPTGARVDGRAGYTVTSDELHAWPELYFTDVGWVRFEPTVSLGVLPAYTLPSSATAPSDEPTVTPTPVATPHGAPSLAPDASTTGSAGGSSGAGQAVTPAEIIILILALLCAPAVFRRWRRRNRLRRLQDGDASVTVAWDELCDTVRDLGVVVSAADTPRAFARRLLAVTGGKASAGGGLARLLAGVERARFGPGDDVTVRVGDLAWADDLRAVLAAVIADASRGSRIVALVAPASLVSNLRPAHAAPGYAA